jgi:hypothetical protein
MAKTTLDCSAMEAFAHQLAVCGREKLRISREVGDRARFISKEHTKYDFEWALVKKMPFPLTNREFLGRYLSFKEPAGDLVVVFEALPDSTKVDYGTNLKVVRGKITGVVRFRPIDEDSQCEVTLVQHVNVGGVIPERVMVAKTPQALGSVGNMRELFQRDDAIDDAKRSELADIIKCTLPAVPPFLSPPALTPPPLPARTPQHQRAAVLARRDGARQDSRRQVRVLGRRHLREARLTRPLRRHDRGLQRGEQQWDLAGNDGTLRPPLPPPPPPPFLP